VQKEAVESGLMKPEFAMRAEEQCPLCFELLHTSNYSALSLFACCGVIICRECECKHLDAASSLATDAKCPFCRYLSVFATTNADFVKRLRDHGEKPWAMEALAVIIIDQGSGTPDETDEALRLLEIGAKQGRMLSQERLGRLYLYGNMEKFVVPRSLDKARAYLTKAIYQGSAIALNAMSDLLREERPDASDHICYETLGAAQGDVACQFSLAMDFAYGKGLEESKGRAIFWSKRAALQGHVEAQALLFMSQLLHFKDCSQLGAVRMFPQAVFWARKGEAKLWDEAVKFFTMIETNVTKMCSTCGEPPQVSLALKRCTRCRAVAYCGRSCQAKHWSEGHREDCYHDGKMAKDLEAELVKQQAMIGLVKEAAKTMDPVPSDQ
jgi:hypothetical protein